MSEELKTVRDYIKDKGLITLRTLKKRFDNTILKATLFDLRRNGEIIIFKEKVLWSKSNPKLKKTIENAITVACSVANKGKCALVKKARRETLKEVKKVKGRIKKRIKYWEDRRSPYIVKVLRSVLLDIEELEEELK